MEPHDRPAATMEAGIEGWHHDRMLDALGLACPLPVLRARKALGAMAPGMTLLIAASDPMAAIDIPHMCRQDGHRLLRRAGTAGPSGAHLYFLVAAGTGRAADGATGAGAAGEDR